jgi:hypothetical protein
MICRVTDMDWCQLKLKAFTNVVYSQRLVMLLLADMLALPVSHWERDKQDSNDFI